MMLTAERKKELIEETKARRRRKRSGRASIDAADQRSQNDKDSMQEEIYKSLVQNIPCAVYSAFPDEVGPTIFMSNKWREWTGYSPEELYQYPEAWPKCIHPDDRQETLNAYTVACTKEVPYRLEYRVVHKDTGQIRYVADQGLLSKDEEGAVVRVDGIVTDTTEYRKAEDALRDSESRYGTVVDNAGEGIAVTQDGVPRFVNPHLAAIMGYSQEESTSRPFIDFVHPDDRDWVMDIHTRRFQGEEVPGVYELRVVDKHGDTKWLENNGILIEWNGRPATLNFLRDITDRKKAELALHESEEKYRQLFEMETDAIMIFDAETRRYIDVNDAAVRLYGYSREEFLSLTPLDISAEREATDTSIKHTAEGFPTRIPLRHHKKKDGTVFPAEISGSSFMLNGRKVMFGVVRDITGRKQAEAELERQRYYLAKAQEMGSIGTWELDIGKNRLVWTDENYRIFGVEVGTELTYEIFLNCVHPEDRDYVDETWKAALNEEPYDIEHRLLVDGRVKWVREKADVKFDKKGIPFLAIGITQDITERKQAEETLQRSEIRHRELFDNMSSGVAVYEPVEEGADFVFKDLNRAGERISMVRRADVVGSKVTEVFPGVREFGLLDVFRRVNSAGKPEHHPVSLYEDDKLSAWYESYVYKLPSGEIVAVYDDVTARRQAQQKLLEDGAQLKSLASQLSRTEERERHRLATTLHDQVGQSLVFSKLKLDELRASGADSELAAALEDVCSSLDRVIQETRTLTFDLSSPILYELGLEAAVAEWLTDEIRKKHGIETEFDDDGQPKPLDDDIRAILFRNVRELLINVTKHAQADKVRVDVRRTGEDICVSVEDDGIGFDPAEVKAVAAKSDKFGLFSIRERLEQLGGLIEIDSEPGRGSRISMRAPLKCETLTDRMEP